MDSMTEEMAALKSRVAALEGLMVLQNELNAKIQYGGAAAHGLDGEIDAAIRTFPGAAAMIAYRAAVGAGRKSRKSDPAWSERSPDEAKVAGLLAARLAEEHGDASDVSEAIARGVRDGLGDPNARGLQVRPPTHCLTH